MKALLLFGLRIVRDNTSTLATVLAEKGVSGDVARRITGHVATDIHGRVYDRAARREDMKAALSLMERWIGKAAAETREGRENVVQLRPFRRKPEATLRGTEPPSRRHSRTRPVSTPLPTGSATRPRQPIAVATSSRSGGSSWRRGLISARVTGARKSSSCGVSNAAGASLLAFGILVDDARHDVTGPFDARARAAAGSWNHRQDGRGFVHVLVRL